VKHGEWRCIFGTWIKIYNDKIKVHVYEDEMWKGLWYATLFINGNKWKWDGACGFVDRLKKSIDLQISKITEEASK